eukprot:gnl/MRDRNA2_/MRDRNA2_171715_c0_seq1.p1 gnl/MRDRNA2_/MRDRNA2_171715_c0~~gnl/MRDRNA2_/MRDRNA2_171715_c0_seq1.p1  ORF type:complete len:368 (-),score=79.56 gnl/MRDRNA2_/MRDRNA2_171715_c0_seq1:365-1441(-)
MDRDGTGLITPMELFKSLRSLNPNTAPMDVLSLMGDTDMDFDSQISFDEFRKLFPSVKGRHNSCAERVAQSMNKQDLCGDLWGKFKVEIEDWLDKIRDLVKRLKKHKAIAADEDGGSRSETEHVTALLKYFVRLITYPPRVPAPEKSEFLAQQLKLRKQMRKKSKEPVQPFGHELFGKVFECRKSKWLAILKEVAQRSEHLLEGVTRDRRRTELNLLLGEAIPVAEDVVVFFEDHLEEQCNILDASGAREVYLPELKRTRRGIPSLGDEEDAAVIELVAQCNKQRQEEREKKEREAKQQQLTTDPEAVEDRKGSKGRRASKDRGGRRASKSLSLQIRRFSDPAVLGAMASDMFRRATK